MALASESVSTPFFNSALTNAETFTALMDEAGFGAAMGIVLGVAATAPSSAPVALDVFSIAVSSFMFSARTGTATMASTAMPNSHTFNFRIDKLVAM
jgi:uncharacterized membrane protein (Fun14 family)